MEHPKIYFDEFELPFLSKLIELEENHESLEIDSELGEDEEIDSYEVKERMESMIPKDAIFIGSIDSELENWTTWSIKDDYFIIALDNNMYDWALFRISWDDNWETWNWSFDARLKGFKENQKEATKYMLLHLWERWQLDLNKKENELYLNFINDI